MVLESCLIYESIMHIQMLTKPALHIMSLTYLHIIQNNNAALIIIIAFIYLALTVPKSPAQCFCDAG